MNWDVLAELASIARAAGERILEVYAHEFDVTFKAPGDPVTAADAAANSLIVDALRARFPGAAVVAEESDPATFGDFRSHAEVFFVDPLDGTREFVARNGQFVVMIGYAREGQACAGVIHSPTLDTTWAGGVGLGARRRIGAGPEEGIQVGSRSGPADALALCSRSHSTPELHAVLSGLGLGRVEQVGSAGLKGARVAEGSADAYVSLGASGKYWDSCALDAIVRAAGGRVSDTLGKPIDYRGGGLSLDTGLVVANPLLHAHIIDALPNQA